MLISCVPEIVGGRHFHPSGADRLVQHDLAQGDIALHMAVGQRLQRGLDQPEKPGIHVSLLSLRLSRIEGILSSPDQGRVRTRYRRSVEGVLDPLLRRMRHRVPCLPLNDGLDRRGTAAQQIRLTGALRRDGRTLLHRSDQASLERHGGTGLDVVGDSARHRAGSARRRVLSGFAARLHALLLRQGHFRFPCFQVPKHEDRLLRLQYQSPSTRRRIYPQANSPGYAPRPSFPAFPAARTAPST